MAEKFAKLVKLLTELPGIGQRQAARLVLAMVNWPDNQLNELASALADLKNGNLFCQKCFNLSDSPRCHICLSPKRDQSKIAVVERVTDLQSMENAAVFGGVYHVLGGSINPTSGIVPENLKIAELKKRIAELKKTTSNIEVILAMSANAYGETTALFLEEEIWRFGVKITRLAKGLAAGSTLEYADETTLANALKHRF